MDTVKSPRVFASVGLLLLAILGGLAFSSFNSTVSRPVGATVVQAKGGVAVAHGGVSVEADELLSLAAASRFRKGERDKDRDKDKAEREEDEQEERKRSLASRSVAKMVAPESDVAQTQTPPPVTSWKALDAQGFELAADSQIAVSRTHVVVTTRTTVGFY